MENQNRKFVTVGRILFGIFVFLIIIPFHASAENETVQHVHDANCGYVEAIEGHPCEHVHDEKCGYVEAQKEIPCDMNCVDKDGDGIIDHDEKCSYRPAIEGHPCEHVHDDNCGYVEAVQGQPCQYEEQLKAQQEAQKDVSTYADGNEITLAEFKAECLTLFNANSNGLVDIDLANRTLILGQNESIDYWFLNDLHNSQYDYVNDIIISNGIIKRATDNAYDLIDIGGARLNSFQLKNMIIDNNDPTLCNGGGLYIEYSDGFSGNLIVENCTFKNFQSNDSGWGKAHSVPIYFKSGPEEVNFQLKNIKFENCYNNYGLIQLQSHFKGTIDNLEIDGQDKKSIGVNIQSAFAPKSSVKISNSHFTNCSIGIDAAGGVLETQSNTIINCETGIYVDRYDSAHYGNVQINSDKLTDNNIGVNFNTNGQLSLNGNVIIKDNVDANLQLNNASGNKVMIKDLGQDANVGIGIDESDLSEGIVLAQKDSSSNTDFNDDFTHLSSDHEDAKYILAVNTDDNTIKLVKKAETKYIVQFDSVGGTAVSSVEVIEGSKLTSPTSDPTKEHYVFDGWYTDDKYTTKWDFDKDVVTSNMTLYAKWKPVEYKISYDLDGGTNHSDNPSSYTIESESITLKNPSKEGYTFKGWKCDGNGDPVEEVTISKGSTGDKTFTACWEIKHFTVTFNSHDGTNVESQTIDYNGLIQQPNAPVKEHYIFDGWYTDEEYITQWDFSKDFVTEDIELHAKWTPKNYNVIFTSFNEEYLNQIVEYNKKITQPENPTKVGYEFVEWYKDSQLTKKWDFDKDVVTSNMTLYAKWKPVEYKISYDLDGGTNHSDNPSSYTIESESITLKNPSKEGYTFKGWKCDDNGDSVEEVTIAKGSTGDKAFTANWKINQYTVTFNTLEGTEIENQVINYNTKVTQPENPTKVGYEFVEWYKDSQLTKKWDFDKDVVTSNVTLYAKWNLVNYTISYELNGGTNHSDNPSQYTVESADIQLKAPTKTGYTFAGWTHGDKDELVTTIVKGSTGDKTFKANWKINQYTVIFHTYGGTEIKNQVVDYNTKVTQPENPTKAGYKFVGWYSDEAYKNQYDFDLAVVKNIELYAKYEEIQTVSKPVSNVAADKRVDKGTKVELSSSTQGATIYYTVDGSVPSSSSLKYTSPILIEEDMTIKAIAIKDEMKDSEVSVFQYRIKLQVSNPISSHDSGKISRKSNNITLSCETKKASIYYTVDGSDPKTNGKAYANGSLIKITQDTTLKIWATMNDQENYVDSDVVTYEYKMLEQVEKPTSSLNGESIKKGTIVELSTSTPDAKIYYTTDGSLPTQESLAYEKGIVLDKDVTIKAIAIKEGMDDSEIGIYQYQVISEGHVDVIIKVEGPENITVPDKEDVLGAVLTDEDYELYKQGNDIIITLECIPLEEDPKISNHPLVSEYQVGKHLDISIYKQIGNQKKEKVSELNKPIQLIVDVPNELLPEEDIVRIYSLLRVHEGEHAILEDKDEKLETITVESHKFSRYVILYKDIVSGNTEDKNQNQGNSTTTTPTQTSTKTGDESPLIGYGILLGASLLGLAMSIKKRKLK
ncbi:MAG: InlB B-repeat-containing protein [Longibaculum sp.]